MLTLNVISLLPDEGVLTLLKFFMGLGIAVPALIAYLQQWIISTILMIRLIHNDCLIDIDGFWRTRPVNRGALLAEKCFFLVLFQLTLIIGGFALNSNTAGPTIDGVTFLAGLAAFASVTPGLSQLLLTALKISIGGALLFTFCSSYYCPTDFALDF